MPGGNQKDTGANQNTQPTENVTVKHAKENMRNYENAYKSFLRKADTHLQKLEATGLLDVPGLDLHSFILGSYMPEGVRTWRSPKLDPAVHKAQMDDFAEHQATKERELKQDIQSRKQALQTYYFGVANAFTNEPAWLDNPHFMRRDYRLSEPEGRFQKYCRDRGLSIDEGIDSLKNVGKIMDDYASEVRKYHQEEKDYADKVYTYHALERDQSDARKKQAKLHGAKQAAMSGMAMESSLNLPDTLSVNGLPFTYRNGTYEFDTHTFVQRPFCPYQLNEQGELVSKKEGKDGQTTWRGRAELTQKRLDRAYIQLFTTMIMLDPEAKFALDPNSSKAVKKAVDKYVRERAKQDGIVINISGIATSQEQLKEMAAEAKRNAEHNDEVRAKWNERRSHAPGTKQFAEEHLRTQFAGKSSVREARADEKARDDEEGPCPKEPVAR